MQHFISALVTFRSTRSSAWLVPPPLWHWTDQQKCRAHVSCLEGKQTRSAHPHQDSGINSPLDRTGGVIFSDVKGSMTPKNRLIKRYMFNFWTTSQTKAAEKYQSFIVHFEKLYGFKIHVLRTNRRVLYTNMDPFCMWTGIVPQNSKARTRTQPERPSGCTGRC